MCSNSRRQHGSNMRSNYTKTSYTLSLSLSKSAPTHVFKASGWQFNLSCVSNNNVSSLSLRSSVLEWKTLKTLYFFLNPSKISFFKRTKGKSFVNVFFFFFLFAAFRLCESSPPPPMKLWEMKKLLILRGNTQSEKKCWSLSGSSASHSVCQTHFFFFTWSRLPEPLLWYNLATIHTNLVTSTCTHNEPYLS